MSPRRNLHTLLLLLGLSALAANPAFAQGDQEPETGPEDPPELINPLSPEQMMKEVQDAIEVVRQSFADVDRLLMDTREIAENSNDEPGSELGTKLDATAQHAEKLMADIEELLSLLPESEQNSKSSGSSSQGQPPKPDQPKPGGQVPEGNKKATEQSTGKAELPPMTPIFMAPGSSGGAWGHLPPRLQETLNNAHAEDLPLRYRGLLEEFHLRNMKSDSQP